MKKATAQVGYVQEIGYLRARAEDAAIIADLLVAAEAVVQEAIFHPSLEHEVLIQRSTLEALKGAIAKVKEGAA